MPAKRQKPVQNLRGILTCPGNRIGLRERGKALRAVGRQLQIPAEVFYCLAKQSFLHQSPAEQKARLSMNGVHFKDSAMLLDRAAIVTGEVVTPAKVVL